MKNWLATWFLLRAKASRRSVDRSRLVVSVKRTLDRACLQTEALRPDWHENARVVVTHPFAKDPSEMSLVDGDQPVQKPPTHRANQSFTEGACHTPCKGSLGQETRTGISAAKRRPQASPSSTRMRRFGLAAWLGCHARKLGLTASATSTGVDNCVMARSSSSR